MLKIAENIKLYGEARRVFGKREMLWNIQRQIYAAKLKGKTINEEWLIKILTSIEQIQQLEEENWNIEQYIDSEIERDVIQESKLIRRELVEKKWRNNKCQKLKQENM